MSEDSPDLLEGAVSPALNPNLFGHGETEAFLAEAYAGGKMHHALLMKGRAASARPRSPSASPTISCATPIRRARR